MEVRRRGDVKSGTDKIGNRVRVKVTKNKVAPPFREAEVEIMFGRGIDKIGDLINIATDLDVIQKSGSWYGFSGERLAQGKEKTVELLTDDPELLQNIKNIVLQTLQKTDTDEGEAEVTPDSPADLGDPLPA